MVASTCVEVVKPSTPKKKKNRRKKYSRRAAWTFAKYENIFVQPTRQDTFLQMLSAIEMGGRSDG